MDTPTRIYWNTVADSLPVTEALRQGLHAVAKQLDPNDRFLIAVEFPYGEGIVTDGKLQLDTENGLSQLLNYAPIPLGLLISGKAEHDSSQSYNPSPGNSFRSFRREYRIPDRILSPGEFIGLFDSGLSLLPSMKGSHSGYSKNITAGSRALYPVLPNADTQTFQEAYSEIFQQDFSRSQTVHSFYQDHHLFVRHFEQETGERWRCKVLFFPKQWLEAGTAWFKEVIFKQSLGALHKDSVQKQQFLNLLRLLRSDYMAAYLQKIENIAKGAVPVMKGVSADDTYLGKYLTWLEDKFEGEKMLRNVRPYLFEYGYLYQGEWGLVPTALPQLPIPGLDLFVRKSAPKRIKEVQQAIKKVNGNLAHLAEGAADGGDLNYHVKRDGLNGCMEEQEGKCKRIVSGNDKLFEGYIIVSGSR